MKLGAGYHWSHVITHALARHGNERMSQASQEQFGGVALSVAVVNQPVAAQSIFGTLMESGPISALLCHFPENRSWKRIGWVFVLPRWPGMIRASPFLSGNK